MARGVAAGITVITAGGRATFTDDQVARLERAGPTTFHLVRDVLHAHALGEMLDGATVAGITPRAVPRLDAGTIATLPSSLRGIAVFATGVDFVDLSALGDRGIVLRRLPGYSTTSVAEHTVGLLLMLSRRLHLSRDRVLGRVPAGTSVRGWELQGKTLGIVGMGRIGRRVAMLARAFGMKVVATDLHDDLGTGVTPHDLETLLSVADVVSLHASTSWGTGPLLNDAVLGHLRPNAHLINASRASLVDEEAVVSRIRDGLLAGYAVDDRLDERVRTHAADLLREGRIVESGHTAWYSQEAIERGTDSWTDLLVELAQTHTSAEGHT